MKKELIFMGPPASGKGTQTKKLAAETGFVHVDTGSLLREAMANGTEAGKIAKEFVEKGALVPVEVVAQIIKDRLSQDDVQKGFILDGFPRSIEQAEMLDEMLKEIDANKEVETKVIYFEIPIENLMERIIYRRSCPKCGAIYNLKTMPIKKEGLCDICEVELVQRKDDTEEIAKNRFDTYFAQTAPLIDFYEKRGLLVKLDATGSIDEIYNKLKEVI
jgi:adenylate kinase